MRVSRENAPNSHSYIPSASFIIFEWDIQADAHSFSPNWRKKFGYDAISEDISSSIPLSQNIHSEDMPAFVKIMRDTAAGVPYSETELRIWDIAGQYCWCRIRATTQFDADGRPIKAVGVIVDIDAEKKQKQALLDQAQRDALTGLYNKAAIHSLVEQHIHWPIAVGSQALLIIDVDNFKSVNDTFGHLAGDSVLSDVASALKGSVRTTDLVGRIGGDEFLVYLSEVSDLALIKAERILAELQAITPVPGAAHITCSIGVAAFPCGGGASAARTAIGSDESRVSDQGLPQYAFRTLYAATDLEGVLTRLLEIIGRAYDVSRAYLFESSPDGGGPHHF